MLRLFILFLILASLTACQPSPAGGSDVPVETDPSPTPVPTVTVFPTTIPTVSVSPSPSPTPGADAGGVPVANTFEQSVKNGSLILTARLQEGLFSLDLTFPGPASSYNAFQVLLDVDRDARTGYRSGILGADLLLENANLLTYTGKGSEWRWMDVTPLELEYRQEGNRTLWEIPLSVWLFTCRAASGKDCTEMLAFAQLADRNWNLVAQVPAMTLRFPSP
jgi:hypothetical protein